MTELTELTEAPDSLAELVYQFEHRTLPLKQWTHQAHLSVGLWMVHTYGCAEAESRMRTGIRAYNESTGGVNGPDQGYHETITLAWLRLLDLYLQQYSSPSLADLETTRAEFLASDYARRDTLLRFYRRETLFSQSARQHWTEPDLTPIAL